MGKKIKRKNIPKWQAGFNIVYLADEHCMSKDRGSTLAKKCELSIRSAVLFNAMGDLNTGEGMLFYEAHAWVNGRVKSMPGYSFKDICDTFNISHEAARTAILENPKARDQLKTYVERMQ